MPDPSPPSAREVPHGELRTLAALFLRLGTTAFGGPAAHIALLQDEVVTRRAWVSPQEFLDMLAATNFIPGPNSTEMAIHIGYRRAGWRGLIVAGSCFILPAALLCTLIAALYVHYGQRPISQSMLWGVKPVVVAVVVQALWKLGKATVRTHLLAVAAALAVVTLVLGVHELLVLFGAGVLVAVAEEFLRFRKGLRTFPMLAPPLFLAAGSTTAAATAAGTTLVAAPLLPLFLVFLKIGSVLFGSGYVLLAFLRADLVQRYGWLTEQQLLDAVAVGQVTPGPVFTTATFIGYLVSGPLGALLATLGIFLPAFFFVAVSAPLLPRLRNSRLAGAFLDGLNVASLALMAVVTWELGRAALMPVGTLDPWAVVLAATSFVALSWRRMNSAWLVLAGAALGLARAWLLGA
jgi:chromate transporter